MARPSWKSMVTPKWDPAENPESWRRGRGAARAFSSGPGARMAKTLTGVVTYSLPGSTPGGASELLGSEPEPGSWSLEVQELSGLQGSGVRPGSHSLP